MAQASEDIKVTLFEFRGVVAVTGLVDELAVEASGVAFDAGMAAINDSLVAQQVGGEVSALMVKDVTGETAQALLDIDGGKYDDNIIELVEPA